MITEERSSSYKLAQRKAPHIDTFVPIQKEKLGENKILVIAGPCSVESKQQIKEIAHAVKEAGAVALRGGAFKPRTSPYSFQGFGAKALEWMAQAREETGLAIVSEIMDPNLVPMFDDYVDVLQIGSRNMQNFHLLKAVAQSKNPILLKRGMGNTLEEYLLAAEYLLLEGNTKVILCERGIRTFERHTRNTFDINAIPALKAQSHLPVLADPSHGTGKWQYVEAIARGAIAAGADGLLVEVHSDPDKALSDGEQSLTIPRFCSLMKQVKKIAKAVDRSV